jgi:glutamine synthetase
MTKNEILQYVKDHPSGKVKIAVTDIDGILRGKYISADKFFSVTDKGLGFCDVIFGWDAGDVVYDNVAFAGWHTGYPDCPAVLDLNTFRKIPWENDIPFFLGELADTNEETGSSTGMRNPSEVCPRQLLKKVLGEAGKQGYHPIFSQEFEWFNFAETPQTANDKQFKNLTHLTPGMFGYSILRSSLQNPYFTDLFELLKKFDVPLEGLHTETGPGVYEAAIVYTGILEAADRAVLFKTAVKEIAYKHGIMATFMAKINENLPGCGGHVHQSLWDNNTEKNNLFYDEKDEMNMSELMKNYIAGQLFCLPHMLPMVAPNINSYKRLVEGSWAPTTLTWGLDNRTVALRVLPGSHSSCRLETRVVGSDVNPYLAMAACLAAGLYGIKNNLQLQPATIGNGYRNNSGGVLPSTLMEATQQMKNSEVAKELFGTSFVEHFSATREWEWRQHLKAVTDWEYRRYFEII